MPDWMFGAVYDTVDFEMQKGYFHPVRQPAKPIGSILKPLEVAES